MVFRRLAQRLARVGPGRQVVDYLELQSSALMRKLTFISQTGLLRVSDKAIVCFDNVYSVPLKRNTPLLNHNASKPQQQIRLEPQEFKISPYGVPGSRPFSGKSGLKDHQVQLGEVMKFLTEKWWKIEKKLPGWQESIVDKLGKFQNKLVNKLSKK